MLTKVVGVGFGAMALAMAAIGTVLIPLALIVGKVMLLRLLFARLGLAFAGLGGGAVSAWLLRIGAAFQAAGGGVGMFTALVAGVSKVLKVLGAINPWRALVVFAAVAFAQIIERWDQIKAHFSEGEWGKFWGVMLTVFEATLNAVTLGLYGFLKGLMGFGTTNGTDERGEKMRRAAAAVTLAVGATGVMPAAANAPEPAQTRPTPIVFAAQQAPARQPGTLGSGTYQITINAAPGMDERALARAVTTELDRRERASDSRRYSRLSDID